MMPFAALPALPGPLSDNLEEVLKLLFSAGSLAVTVYFWFVRANRERVSVAFYQATPFEGVLETGAVGVWRGRLYLANRSTLPTAVVEAKAELWWDGRWLPGALVGGEGSELPWNLPPAQAFSRSLVAAFQLAGDTPRERVYENQRLRLTFLTVEGHRLVKKVETNPAPAARAA